MGAGRVHPVISPRIRSDAARGVGVVGAAQVDTTGISTSDFASCPHRRASSEALCSITQARRGQAHGEAGVSSWQRTCTMPSTEWVRRSAIPIKWLSLTWPVRVAMPSVTVTLTASWERGKKRSTMVRRISVASSSSVRRKTLRRSARRFATHGSAPESVADDVHYPGTYLAGCYNRLASTIGGRTVSNEDMVRLPDWTAREIPLPTRGRTARRLAHTRPPDPGATATCRWTCMPERSPAACDERSGPQTVRNARLPVIAGGPGYPRCARSPEAHARTDSEPVESPELLRRRRRQAWSRRTTRRQGVTAPPRRLRRRSGRAKPTRGPCCPAALPAGSPTYACTGRSAWSATVDAEPSLGPAQHWTADRNGITARDAVARTTPVRSARPRTVLAEFHAARPRSRTLAACVSVPGMRCR